ncbi:hypothetical protein RJZ57_005159 [Blastomyces gilchristii]
MSIRWAELGPESEIHRPQMEFGNAPLRPNSQSANEGRTENQAALSTADDWGEETQTETPDHEDEGKEGVKTGAVDS